MFPAGPGFIHLNDEALGADRDAVAIKQAGVRQ